MVDKSDNVFSLGQKRSLAERFQQVVRLIERFDLQNYLGKDEIGRENAITDLSNEIVAIIDEPEHADEFFKSAYAGLKSGLPTVQFGLETENINCSEGDLKEAASGAVRLKLGELSIHLGIN